jgi:hypothetical protein
MVIKNPPRTAKSRQPKRRSSTAQVSPRLKEWHRAVEHLLPEDLCFAVSLALPAETASEVTKFLEQTLRDRDVLEKVPYTPPTSDAELCSKLALIDRKHIRAMEKAFKWFQLDVKKRADWDHLRTRVLGKRGRGRPKDTRKWDKGRLYALGAHLYILEGIPNASDIELAQKLREMLPEYRYENPDNFRKRVGASRRMFRRLLEEDVLTASDWLYAAGYHQDKAAREARGETAFDSHYGWYDPRRPRTATAEGVGN